MKRFQNVLVSVDSRFDQHSALQWAVQLAKHNHAKLTIIDVLPDLSWLVKLLLTESEDAHEALAEQKRRVLDTLAESVRDQGVEVTTKLLTGKTSFAIMHEVLRSGHDLVVRVTKGAHSGGIGFFGTTSKRLLRKCPCAIWLVRPDTAPRFERVLATIDPAPGDLTRDLLNTTIMDLARSVADYEQGEVHVVHVWNFIREHLLSRSQYTPDEIVQFKREAEANVARALDRFLSPYELNHNADTVHLLSDAVAPGRAISDLAIREQIDLVVMGTIGRTGLKGALIGNTAEQVLDRIQCSVLAIKPDGFTSPVSLPDE